MGTGSYPVVPHGWQRDNRFNPIQKPFPGPWTFMAVTIYSEHVGT
jgi:hypothetical protein